METPEHGAPRRKTGCRTLRPLTTRMCGRAPAGRAEADIASAGGGPRTPVSVGPGELVTGNRVPSGTTWSRPGRSPRSVQSQAPPGHDFRARPGCPPLCTYVLSLLLVNRTRVAAR